MENKICYEQEEQKNFLSMCTPVFDALHSHEMQGHHDLIQQVHPVLTYDLSQPSNFYCIFKGQTVRFIIKMILKELYIIQQNSFD